MNIVIVGGGLVGSTLAEKLSKEGHDVSLVEREAASAAELEQTLDARVVAGNGTHAAVLRDAGAENAHLIVATTDSDEVNLLVGFVAAELFHAPRLVVRLRDEAHREAFEEIRRDHPEEHVHVNPDDAAVDRIVSLLEVPGALDVASFMDDELLVVGFRIHAGSDFAGLRVSHVELLFAGKPTLVAAIHRGDVWIIPHGEDEIRPDDLVYFAVARSQLDSVLTLIGVLQEQRRHIMIAGADRVGLALARRLEGSGQRVIVIEADAACAEAAAQQLREAVVVCGPVTDQALLEEEEIERVATFVALTPDFEDNLVAGLLAKRLGAARAFALVDNPALANLIGEVGIDAIISPRLLAIGLILRHIHGGRVRSVAPLIEDRVEILEADVAQGSLLTRAPLAELGLPRGVLVAAVRRGRELRVPRGDDRIAPGDQVLLISTTEVAAKLDDFLEG